MDDPAINSSIAEESDLPDRLVAWWLWTGAGLVFLILVIGGITRLTDSGLSMSDWNLIMGALPPLSDADWTAAFERYKQFPQYQQVNVGMTLGEFKKIFLWEYLHRLAGRITGIVFLVPFIIFWRQGYFNRPLLKRMFILFGLGIMQAGMGWFMVKSGLADMPYVSHYRLAAHLMLAFVLIGCCVWFAMDLQRNNQSYKSPLNSGDISRWIHAVTAVFAVQVIWGAFTAGLNAGYIYNTFPMMNGSWLPENAWTIEPVWINLIENPGTVQWMHRVMASLLTAMVIGLWIKGRVSGPSRSMKARLDIMLGLIMLQFVLGIATVLTHVPVVLGVAHQAVAALFWISLLLVIHRNRRDKFAYL